MSELSLDTHERRSMIKQFRDMTDTELEDELATWNDAVQRSTHWGAALAQAAKWRDQCERILSERRANRVHKGWYAEWLLMFFGHEIIILENRYE